MKSEGKVIAIQSQAIPYNEAQECQTGVVVQSAGLETTKLSMKNQPGDFESTSLSQPKFTELLLWVKLKE